MTTLSLHIRARAAFPAVALALAGLNAAAAEQTVQMKGMAFAPKSLTVKAGTTLKFVNDDPVPHSVLSVSDGSNFNLGVVNKGVQDKRVTLTTPGTVMVECGLHPAMVLSVEVTK